jgi:hypothetical protein
MVLRVMMQLWAVWRILCHSMTRCRLQSFGAFHNWLLLLKLRIRVSEGISTVTALILPWMLLVCWHLRIVAFQPGRFLHSGNNRSWVLELLVPARSLPSTVVRGTPLRIFSILCMDIARGLWRGNPGI